MPSELEIGPASFERIRDRETRNGGVFAGTELIAGFPHQGDRITLAGPSGIRFPRGFRIPLSIRTIRNGPYRLDDIGEDGFLTHAYRGTNPGHRSGPRHESQIELPSVTERMSAFYTCPHGSGGITSTEPGEIHGPGADTASRGPAQRR